MKEKAYVFSTAEIALCCKEGLMEEINRGPSLARIFLRRLTHL